jgi:ATP-dependent Clp protease protease subunit
MKRNLPLLPAAQSRVGMSFDFPKAALAHWNPAIQAAASAGEDASISIFDPIGYDPWTGDGVTAKRVGAVLRGLNGAPVTVNINSPGGDMFEGLAIYNLLREHKGDVTVNVIGLAASAASIIAMAGDTLQIGRSAFLMIHNCWVVVAGNKNELREAADTIDPFDRALADVYSARTGMDFKAVAKLMDAETFLAGSDAVAQGFADALLPADQITERSGDTTTAARALDTALARSGMPRSERRRLISEIKGTPSAAHEGTPSAADPAELAASTAALLGVCARLESAAKR